MKVTHDPKVLHPDIQFLYGLGLEIEQFTEYHYRVFGCVDIYPTTQTIHKTGTGDSYSYKGVDDLLCVIQKISGVSIDGRVAVENSFGILFWLRMIFVAHVVSIIIYLFFLI